MTGGLRLLAFLGLSCALHAAPWMVWGTSGQQAAGGGGEDQITLSAAPQSLGALVEKWERPVETSPQPPVLHPPQIIQNTQPAQRSKMQMSLPDSTTAMHAPATEALPRVDTTPPPPPKPAPKKIEKKAPKPAAASTPRKAEKAKGPGKAVEQGNGGKAAVSTGNSKREAKLLHQWGAQIKSRIERQKRAAGARGKVRIRVVVHTSGKLASATVIKSSGVAALDAAALKTATRARLPNAPKAVAPGTHAFTLSLNYNR
ncbi:TonB family protein [Shimia sp. SDUM112013]|uniref:energy transducer TonB family protein n=1 Tax=Shimia sp. SDUM112013 TaxID=3136160 RepID=UPI0032EE4B3C